jgi:flavin-dependent dehydrogenase
LPVAAHLAPSEPERENALMVAPTLNLLQAAGRDWDVVVVGAGPAGSLAAFHLARRGLTTLLVERATLPRWKVCGCCLNPRAAVVLERAGLGSLLSSCGAVPLSAVLLGAGGSAGKIPLNRNFALSRESFDTALARAAVEAGAHFLPGTRATLEEGVSQDHRRLWLQQGAGAAEVRARVVLSAVGLGGHLLGRPGVPEAPSEPGSRIGAGVTMSCPPDSFYTPGTIFMACGQGGYVGLVRLEDDRLDLAAAFDSAAVRSAGGPGGLAVRILAEVGWPGPPLLREQPWKGTVPLTRRARHLAEQRVFVLGDAAGYVEPFTGEGMAWALASAEGLTPLVAAGVRCWDDSLAVRWARQHARIVTRRQWACRATAALLRRPRLTAAVVAVLARVPMLAVPVVRFLAAPPPSPSGAPLESPR